MNLSLCLLIVSSFYYNLSLSLCCKRFISMKVKKNGFDTSTQSLWKYQPRTDNQIKYVDHLLNPNISIVGGFGPAGCGKTLFACHAAVGSLKSGLIDKIVITRPLIAVDEEELGFLPGTIANKMDPWTRPIFDVLGEFYSVQQIQSMVDNGVIEISPLAYMRGRTFKRSFIIADEMQNSSPNQMLMMLTRIGEDSKLVITGDLKQSDRSGVNGLRDFIEKLRTSNNDNSLIEFIELDTVDIQRSPVVAHILNIYESNNKNKNKNQHMMDAAIIPKGYDARSYTL
jgi:phosphate starvation-inducible PhoH-like protein